jgi:hypothetical protein
MLGSYDFQADRREPPFETVVDIRRHLPIIRTADNPGAHHARARV